MFNVLAHLEDKQPYTCDECGVGFNYDDYVRQPYHCKKHSKWSKTFYMDKVTKKIKCMMKTSTWKAKGNKTYHYCFDCADVS